MPWPATLLSLSAQAFSLRFEVKLSTDPQTIRVGQAIATNPVPFSTPPLKPAHEGGTRVYAKGGKTGETSRYLTLTSGVENPALPVPVPAPAAVTTLSSDAFAISLVLEPVLPGRRTPLLRRLTRALIRIGTSTLRLTIEAPRLVSRLWRRSCGRVSSPPTTTAVEARRRGFDTSAGVSLRPRGDGGVFCCSFCWISWSWEAVSWASR
jgi:hypothetical protein